MRYLIIMDYMEGGCAVVESRSSDFAALAEQAFRYGVGFFYTEEELRYEFGQYDPIFLDESIPFDVLNSSVQENGFENEFVYVPSLQLYADAYGSFFELLPPNVELGRIDSPDDIRYKRYVPLEVRNKR